MNKKLIIKIGLTLLIGAFFYYVTLPPLNVQSSSFWTFLLFIFIVYKTISVIMSVGSIKHIAIKEPKINKWPIFIIGGIFIGIILINIIVSPLFNADSYSKRVNVLEDNDFITDVKEVDFNQIPLLDKDSSQKLGDRVMGQMPELVSQFYVSDLYTQINYNSDIVRVTPLEYNGIIKYFTNRSDGVKGYITVNSVTGESNLIKLNNGMKYMPSALFGENLLRKLRFNYPTKVFGEESFEIDNEGNPYWIVPCLKFSGVGLKKDVKGIIILNPVTGDSNYYDVKDVPTWVDHVYSADLIIEQVDDWGNYRKGYWNSIFGQKNVVATTDGYNYTVMNDDVYLYTGITSASSDESNIGFILTNMRTKETKYYAVPGAEEYSAMGSAEGQVQQMDYESSFPLLINLNNRPTYLMSLKDNAGLVKMYAFVDVVDYQKVVVTDAAKGIKKAAENYLNQVDIIVAGDEKELDIEIDSIVSVIIDNTTYYYLTDTSNNKYRVNIKTNEYLLPFLKKSNKVKITYVENEKINEIMSIN